MHFVDVHNIEGARLAHRLGADEIHHVSARSRGREA
jgi:hypothetical protein